MTEHSLWRFSRALHRAINERQPDDLEALLDDDVDWAIYGPIDMFPFLGARRGKAAVLEVLRQIADNIRVHRFDRESMMLGEDQAASMMRYSLTALDSDKPISLADRAFRAVQGGSPDQHPRAGRHLRSGGAGARPSRSICRGCRHTPRHDVGSGQGAGGRAHLSCSSILWQLALAIRCRRARLGRANFVGRVSPIWHAGWVMISRIRYGRSSLLLAAGISMASMPVRARPGVAIDRKFRCRGGRMPRRRYRHQ